MFDLESWIVWLLNVFNELYLFLARCVRLCVVWFILIDLSRIQLLLWQKLDLWREYVCIYFYIKRVMSVTMPSRVLHQMACNFIQATV
jgi:hypothetical protein